MAKKDKKPAAKKAAAKKPAQKKLAKDKAEKAAEPVELVQPEGSILALPQAVLPEIDGVKPIGIVSRLSGTGERIHRAISYGEKTLILAVVETTKFGLAKTAAGPKLDQTLAITEFFEFEEIAGKRLLSSARLAQRQIHDQLKGRQQLPGMTDERGEALPTVVDGHGTALTPEELAEAQGGGDALLDELGVVEEFDDDVLEAAGEDEVDD